MLLLACILFPVLAGCALPRLFPQKKARRAAFGAGMVLSDGLCLACALWGKSVTLARPTDTMVIAFSLDSLGKVFLLAGAVLYTAACFYALGYMDHEEREETFFSFYLVSFGALAAVGMASNLITLYLCFEALTLTSMPLVLHERSREAVAAGVKYLFYSVAGALAGLLSVFFVYYYSGGEGQFVLGGFMKSEMLAGHEGIFLAAVLAGILGFGTKAGLYPMHGWLPSAHPIAPAPASAVLSGIIAKAGVIAVIRLVYYAVGPEMIRGTYVETTWRCLAILTILMGSTMAFYEKNLKKRLAYSTVSQISYIMLGLSFLSPAGLAGGLLHLMGHAVSKGALFLAAGSCIFSLGIRAVPDMSGIGKKLPATMACFTLASLSLVGIPPMSGFLSKWQLAGAAIGSGRTPWDILSPVVLLISALLTAGYLLTVVTEAFFPGNAGAGEASAAAKGQERPIMTIPIAFLCLCSLLVGLFGQRILSYFGFM